MRPKVFVIDDQPEISTVIKMYLGHSYEINYYKSGRQALEELTKGNLPDIILSDIKMPEYDGYDVLKNLKVAKKLCNIPVMMISNLEASKERLNCIDAGACDYIEKPFTSRELKTKIDAHLFTTCTHSTS